MSQPNTRYSLIVRLGDDHDDEAWAEFVAAYEPFLFRLVERQGVWPQHQADVVQQVLMAVARSVDGWSDDGKSGSFRRWLSTVARNIVIKFMTRERRQVTGAGGTDLVALLQAVPDVPEEDHLRRYEHEMIVWAAEQVRDEFITTSWAAFVATVVDGRPVADVAAELSITPGSIYMSRSRIVARIKQVVDGVLG